MATKVKPCTCTGPSVEFQEKLYGKGNRLHNEKVDGKGAKCTVCGALKK